MLNTLKHLYKSAVYASSAPVVNVVPNAKAVTVILGFGGSHKKNFTKLVQHYESKNVSTVLHIMPMFCPKFVRTAFEEDISELLHQQTHGSDSPLKTHIHVFSQNGTWVLSNLLKRSLLPDIDTVIFDSTPAFKYARDPPVEADELSRVFTSIVHGKAQYYQFPFTPIVKFGLLMMLHLSAFVDRIWPRGSQYRTDYIGMSRYIRDNFPQVPILFIYSAGDKLIPPANVQEFMGILKTRGVQTSEYLFGEE
eukprot:gene22504-25499_t